MFSFKGHHIKCVLHVIAQWVEIFLNKQKNFILVKKKQTLFKLYNY